MTRHSRQLLRALLNDVAGWGATVVHDAEAAREVFCHVRLEVLVLDINLPGISGLELLELLLCDPRWNEPPVILLSANANQPGSTRPSAGAMRCAASPSRLTSMTCCGRSSWRLPTTRFRRTSRSFATPNDRTSPDGEHRRHPHHEVRG